jgi:hypothetical protein
MIGSLVFVCYYTGFFESIGEEVLFLHWVFSIDLAETFGLFDSLKVYSGLFFSFSDRDLPLCFCNKASKSIG